MRLLFIVDPLDRLTLHGDTSYALMLEAARREHEVWSCQLEHLALEHDDAIVDAALTRVQDATVPVEAFAIQLRKTMPLAAFDMVFMRKDPPFDVNYLQATWLLEHARGQTLLINDPRGLRELNEHLAVLRFPELTPPTIVTRDQKRLAEFREEQGGAIIVKPVDGFGGLGIFLVRADDPNASSIYETATAAGKAWTVAQRYLPEAAEGDKRILLVAGEPVGALLRVPSQNSARGNLHVGGRAVRTEVTDADRQLIAEIAPTLAEYGQIFVGIDVIGGRLTEINLTSPTGVRHIERLEQRNLSGEIMARFEALARARKPDDVDVDFG